MKIPALRAQLGDREYYITTLTFEQVSLWVSPINDQLHKSETLNQMIQRSITKNYLSIKDYILNQSELFFNSLVLAVYDNYPEWSEIEFKFDDTNTYQVGLLNFPGAHKIFPVDGQHRVEGIKAALIERPSLKDEKIAAIFIGHKNNDVGKEKTRRLFTTLNRYAKPVSLDDIIALDEDDIVAIVTRYLLEEYDLFIGKRIVYAQQKGIPVSNKDALTSIITLYQANVELFKAFYYLSNKKELTKTGLINYLKFRPNKEEINNFQIFSINYWNAFKTNLSFIQDYLKKQDNPVQDHRNSENGGNLVFRPIGFLPLIKASININKITSKSFDEIFEAFNKLNFNLDQKPWLNLLWNPIERKMHSNQDALTQLLLIYMYEKSLLSEKDLQKLKRGYASKTSSEENDIDKALNTI